MPCLSWGLACTFVISSQRRRPPGCPFSVLVPLPAALQSGCPFPLRLAKPRTKPQLVSLVVQTSAHQPSPPSPCIMPAAANPPLTNRLPLHAIITPHCPCFRQFHPSALPCPPCWPCRAAAFFLHTSSSENNPNAVLETSDTTECTMRTCWAAPAARGTQRKPLTCSVPLGLAAAAAAEGLRRNHHVQREAQGH